MIERLSPSLAACAAVLLGACVAGESDARERSRELGPGTWVEIQGRIVDGAPVVEEVEAIPRSESDTREKFELSGPIEALGEGGTVSVLGSLLETSAGTGYVDESGVEVHSLPLRVGEGVRVKARERSAGGWRAREIRAWPTVGRFEVEGEIRSFDRDRGRIVVGAVDLALPQDVRFDEGEAQRAGDPLQLFQADEQTSVPFSIQLADGLKLGGQVGLGLEHDEDRDLDDARKRDETQLELEAKLDLLWSFGSGSFALLEGKFAHDLGWQEGSAEEEDSAAEITRAFTWFAVNEQVRVQAGRFDFDEEREWLYDEILDGVRVLARAGDLEFELAAATGREFAASEGNPTEDTATYVALARWFVDDDDWWLTAYAFVRDDTAMRDFEPQLFGLRSFSRPYRGLGHWAELALARGHAADRDIDGRAFDVGLLYRFDAPLSPIIALGYAYGEGRDPNGDTDGFRQSGWNDNNAKFGGVTSLKYYGEVFEPELANLGIATLGVGVRPMPSLAVDLVLHEYRQDYLAAALYANDLRARPNGRSAALGWEADLVIGWRRERSLSAEFVLGRFDPGSGFDLDDPAWQFEFTVRAKF